MPMVLAVGKNTYTVMNERGSTVVDMKDVGV
jgi:hypothetical protein